MFSTFAVFCYRLEMKAIIGSTVALATSIALPVAFALVACSSTTTNNATGDGGVASPDGATSTAAQNLTCLGVLQCIVSCNTNDDACGNACLAQGTADGQAKANTLVSCLSTNNCMDPMCLKDHCMSEYNACLTVPAPTGGKPITGNAPMGSVPPDFVGTWKYTGASTADDFTFNADGTASRKQIETSSFGGCSSTIAFEYSGTVIFTPAKDGFTFYITTATNTSNQCGASTTMPATTGAFDFTLEAIPALGPGKYWFFRVQDCPVTAEADKRIQCGNEYDLGQ